MRITLITASLILITTGAAKAQVAGSSGSNTNAAQPDPAATSAPAAAAPPGSFTNAIVAGPGINEPGSFGVGAMLGEPLGLSLKYWLSDQTAVDGGVGYSFEDEDGCQLHADVLFHKFDLWRADTRDLPVYVGVGGRVKFVDRGDNHAGIRIPVGVSYLMRPQRLELFAEVAPVVDLAPETTLEWNGEVGIRFYFSR